MKNEQTEDRLDSKTAEAIKPSKVQQAPANFKPTVHVAMSKDGGSGKSTLSRILCEWYIAMKRDFIIIDADENTPNLARVYAKDIFAKWGKDAEPESLTFSKISGKSDRSKSRLEASTTATDTEDRKDENVVEDLFAEQIVFDDSPHHLYLGDRFLEIIETCNRDVIVSLPAGNKFDFWLDTNQIDKSTSKGNLPFKIVIWWCSFGSSISQKTFVEFANKYPNIDIVFVRNMGIRSVVTNWDKFRFDPVVSTLKSKKAKIAAIQAWLSNPNILEEVDRSTTFNEVLKNGLNGKPFSSTILSKIEAWFEANWDSFKKTGHLG